MTVYIVKITHYFPSQDGHDCMDYEYSGVAWKSKADAENEKNMAIDDGFKNAYIAEVEIAI